MTRSLDILVVESHPSAADDLIDVLLDAGHRVHTCHDPGDPAFPCRGLRGQSCPFDGGIDVVVAVRRRVTPQPTPRELGVLCGLRAGIPVIEDGPTILDPFEPFVTAHNPRDLPAACEEAARASDEPLRREIVERTARLLRGAGVDPAAVACAVERDGPRLRVELSGPAVARPIEQALGVRVLDAVRAGRRTYGQVDVSYRPTFTQG